MTRMMLVLGLTICPAMISAQAVPSNPLWHEQKTRNYLPHMTWPEVQELRTRTDMVIIPIAALEQHSLHLPIGTDFLNGLERAKLVAQKADVLVAPILFPGNSPYHMEFAGTTTPPCRSKTRSVVVEGAGARVRNGAAASPSSTAMPSVSWLMRSAT